MERVFYQPDGAWLGDVIPFADEHGFSLFYLHDVREGDIKIYQTSWHMVRTLDFRHFEDFGTVLPHGEVSDPDNSCYTGCVCKDSSGGYHMFYTTHNHTDDRYHEDGKPFQTIAHATSDDLIHWTKHLEERFGADADRYEVFDWRDPFVFAHPETGCYTMLVAARKRDSGYRRGGCLARCQSMDLVHWEIGEPIFAPDLYITHECPDLFQWGQWWYLVYSTFSDKFVTHYRMSRSLQGPWVAPPVDSWDARAFYAAKTAQWDGKRYAFGWIPTREGNSDFGPWQWGGALAVHQLWQAEDGTLLVRMPEELERGFCQQVELMPVGKHDPAEGPVRLRSVEALASASFGGLPRQCLLEAMFSFSQAPRAFGFALCQDAAGEAGYFLRFEPAFNRLVFDLWPRKPLCDFQHSLGGDIPFQVDLERWIDFSRCEVKVKVVLEDSICVVYVDDRTALSVRMYDLRGNAAWSVFVQDGEVAVSGLGLRGLAL